MNIKNTKKYSAWLVVCLTVILVSACSPAIRQVDFGPAELKPGEEVYFEDLTLRFNSVIEDSRCPADATCMQAGEASISVTVSAAGEQAKLELVSMMDGGTPVSFQGYLISFTDLQPYPLASNPTNPDNYTATIQVSPE